MASRAVATPLLPFLMLVYQLYVAMARPVNMPRVLSAFVLHHYPSWRHLLSRPTGLPKTVALPGASTSTMGQKRRLSGTVRHSPAFARARVSDDITTAARELREQGRLVAFPTETVYGLGANAYNETAVHYVFQVKGRPLTDPLIVHVSALEGAWPVYRCQPGSLERSLLSHLGSRFWPGPLTLVAPAAETIPLSVTAGTGWVGVRCPQLKLARRFLDEAKVPVVAPSANRFGHVSPTTAEHVVADLGEHDIIVLKAGTSTTSPPDGEEEEEHCEVGIESTVAKVDVENRQITILRSGAITPSDLRQCLEDTAFQDFVVQGKDQGSPMVVGVGPQVSPGTSLRHYAPDAPTFLVRPTASPEAWLAEVAAGAVIVDVGGRLAWLRPHCHAYRDLTARGGGIREAARGLFEALRWAEVEANRSEEGGGKVLLCDLSHGSIAYPPGEEEFAAAVADRMMRAASGKVVHKDDARSSSSSSSLPS